MNDLERFAACMNYQDVDYTPFWGWYAWEETLALWKSQGIDNPDIEQGADKKLVFPDWFFPDPPFERKVIEEDDRTIVYVNEEGILMRELKENPDSSMPQFIKFPVETKQDFRAFWKEHMTGDLASIIGPNWKENLKAERAKPHPFIVNADRWGGFFGPLRNLVGVEKLCMLFYDDPAFIEEMMDAFADFIITVMSQVLDVITVDMFLFWEDMAYKTAPLISPDLVAKFMSPRYTKVVDFLSGRGVDFVGLDSDGNIHSLIPVWLDAGLNILWPFEVQAGMDVVDVRKRYGKNLRMSGGVDKRPLTKGPAAIDAELERLRPLIEEGGYIPHLDHGVPPDVPYENYCYYMKKLAEVCGSLC